MDRALATPTVQALLSALDNGPASTILESVVLHVKGYAPNEQAFRALSYSAAYETLGRKLEQLVLAYGQDLDAPTRTTCTLISVSRFIFTSNHLEHAGLPTEGDTREAICSAFVAPHRTPSPQSLDTPTGLNDVLRTFNLLSELYHGDDLGCGDPHLRLCFDPSTLRKWHQSLFLPELPSAGKFRLAGSVTRDGTHLYPHHRVLPISVQQLGMLVYNLWKAISHPGRSPFNRLLDCFALAAFAQFHFVDLHPFVDGNGRICRIICKRILDWVLPVPIPMFPDRDIYIGALMEGRNQHHQESYSSPAPLLQLLLETAVQHYTDLLAQSRAFEVLITAACGSDVETEALAMHLSPGSVARLRAAFNEMKEGEAQRIALSENKVVRLHRQVGLSIDEI